ncbi:MAG: hypothetical protein IT373_22890 [Polyangiaceae bacterium]|nr:hypothetical protein [Polyangiaceae bacterium]
MLGPVALAACGSPPPPPPTAVIRATPSSLCVNDDHATLLTLDGSASAAEVTLVPLPPLPDAPKLEYAWSLAGTSCALEGGSFGAALLFVTCAAERPLHVTLRVTSPSGGEAESLATVPITFPETVRCDASACPDGERCVTSAGVAVCAPEASCEGDESCPACTRCDRDIGACVPKELAP